MKNKSIYIAILNQGNIRPEMADLMSGLSRQRKYEILINYPCAKPITNNRNQIVKRFLETEMDYLLMLDNDCVANGKLLELADYDKDIIGGVSFGYLKQMLVPFVMKKKLTGKYDVIDINKNSGVIECDAIGSGNMMIARRVLEELPFPFRNEYDPEGIKTRGLDFNFCRRAKKLGYRVWVDTDMLVSHWTTVDLKTMWETFNSIKDRALEVVEAEIEKGLAYKNSISGWMIVEQLDWLFEVSKVMKSIVEVGSYKGRSTHALLSGCKGTVSAVDPFTDYGKKGSYYKDFMDNVGEFKNLKPFKMTSEEASKKFKDKSVDMVFIDGGHSYKDVKKDIELWLPKAKKLICGHDYQGADVRRAVDEKFKRVSNINNIWVHKIYDKDTIQTAKKAHK